MFFFLFNHFPYEAALVEMILHLFVERICDELLELISLVALEAEKIHQDDGMYVAAVLI